MGVTTHAYKVLTNQKSRIMTKQETTLLLEALKNAPIVDGVITVHVCGTTFTFGDHWRNKITEDGRSMLIENISRVCRARMARTTTKKQLDADSRKSQERLLWWKDNLDETDAVFRALDMLKEFEAKWADYKWYNANPKEIKEHGIDELVVRQACAALGIDISNIKAIAYLRTSVPRSWERAYEESAKVD
jgi:hypothetical protein